jgi:hypothetical protein
MSFVDLIPPKYESVSFSRIKQDQQREIERQTSEFIAMGGAVKEIPYGVVCEDENVKRKISEFNAFGDLQ